jgi:hypothetical protein
MSCSGTLCFVPVLAGPYVNETGLPNGDTGQCKARASCLQAIGRQRLIVSIVCEREPLILGISKALSRFHICTRKAHSGRVKSLQIQKIKHA